MTPAMLAKDYMYHNHTSLHSCTFVLKHKDLPFLKAAWCQHACTAQLNVCAYQHTEACPSLVATLHIVMGKVYTVQLLGWYCMTVYRFVTCYCCNKATQQNGFWAQHSASVADVRTIWATLLHALLVSRPASTMLHGRQSDREGRHGEPWKKTLIGRYTGFHVDACPCHPST